MPVLTQTLNLNSTMENIVLILDADANANANTNSNCERDPSLLF